MPIYAYKCLACGHRQEHLSKLVDAGKTVYCEKCGQPTTKQLSVPAVRADYPGYSCPVTGQWVEGRKAHRENLARTGCRILEPGEQADAKRRHVASEAAFDAAVDQTAGELLANLPDSKREQLAKELSAGVDVSVTRSTPNS